MRKKSNTELVAGVRQHLYPGDRVLTDDKTIVHLALNDGTLLRLGLNGDLRLESSQVEMGVGRVRWVFRLEHGTVRGALDYGINKTSLLRVVTPEAVLEAQEGGAFLLDRMEADPATAFFAEKGRFQLGEPDCEKKRSCVPVQGRQFAIAEKGKPIGPQPYKDLLPIGPAANKKRHLLALLEGLKRGGPTDLEKLDDPGRKKLLDNSSAEFEAAQDRLIGRSKEEREAMAKARQSGAYDETLALGAAYAFAKGVFDPRLNGEAEAYLAQIQAEQFRLGRAVKRAIDSLGPKFDPAFVSLPGTGQARKKAKAFSSHEYYSPAEVKAIRVAVADALDQYTRVLVFADAVQTGETAARGSEALYCEELSCLQSAIVNELSAMEEGLVASYAAGKGPPKQAANANSTRFFSRTGTGCYRMVQDCRRNACTATVAAKAGAPANAAKKCRPGEGVRTCATRTIFVPCD